MSSDTRTTRRGICAAAVAAVLSAAPAMLSAQAPTQAPPPPAGGPDGGQPPMGGPGMRGGRGGGMRMLLEGITLTDAQQTRVDSINRAYGERMRARRELVQGGAAPAPGAAGGRDAQRPDSAARAARFQEMRREMADHNAAIRAVLTGDQQKTFDANVARVEQMRQQRMRDGGMGPGGMGPGGRGRK